MGRQDELVEAAFARVADVGFEGLRLRPVAEDVGIDHSTVHHHFATKQHLIDAVAEYTTRQFWVLGDGPDDPIAALRAHLAGLRTMLHDRPELFAVSVELDLRARRDPAVGLAMNRYEKGWREVLRSLFSAGNTQGSWNAPVNPEAATDLVIAVVKGVRLAPESAESAFAFLEELLIKGGRP